MSLLSICQWMQGTQASIFLRESTWGFPILGAFHVLGIAWFGGAVLVSDLRALRHDFLPEMAQPLLLWKRAGLVFMLLSGTLLFWTEPLKCYGSVAFRIKMALLILVGVNALAAGSAPGRARLGAYFSLGLWIAMILASQGIAFF
jgi:hypothetical protein